MHTLVTARKGVSSAQLAREIGVTQKTAWFLLHRLREACADDGALLAGTVEADETYIGGRERNKHFHRKTRADGAVGKIPVLGLRERGSGHSFAVPVENTERAALAREIEAHVRRGSELHTDEHSGYDGTPGYFRRTVNHSRGNYVAPGNVHCNSVESMWAVRGAACTASGTTSRPSTSTATATRPRSA